MGSGSPLPGKGCGAEEDFHFCPFRDAGAGRRRRIGRRQSRFYMGLSLTLPITRNIQKIRAFLGSSNAMDGDAAHRAIYIERHLRDGYRVVRA